MAAMSDILICNDSMTLEDVHPGGHVILGGLHRPDPDAWLGHHPALLPRSREEYDGCMDDLHALRTTIETLNARLEPIASREVDINDPDWEDKLSMTPSPLDEAGVRQESEAALTAAIDLYTRSDGQDREAIRQTFRRNPAFAWAATLPFEPDNNENTLAHLTHFSIIDQGMDARDAVLWLSDLLGKANVSPEELEQLRGRAAALSSDVDLYGFGSTKQLLARGYGPLRKT